MDLRGADRQTIAKVRKILLADNAKYPAVLQRQALPKDIPNGEMPIELWRSSYFLVQVFAVSSDPEMLRLSINRCDVDKKTGHWREDISWNELQELKRQCGYGDKDAVEIFPADRDIVNVANMRHLWIFKSALPFAWRKPQESP